MAKETVTNKEYKVEEEKVTIYKCDFCGQIISEDENRREIFEQRGGVNTTSIRMGAIKDVFEEMFDGPKHYSDRKLKGLIKSNIKYHYKNKHVALHLHEYCFEAAFGGD